MVDAQIMPGQSGGVEQAIVGLAASFKELNDSELEFYWLTLDENVEWLKPFAPDKSKFVINSDLKNHGLKSIVRLFISKLEFLDFLISFLRQRGIFKFKLPSEPEIVKKIDPTIIHFPLQFGFETERPNIYQPHDLQHLHLSEFFPKETLTLRKIGYSFMSKQASRIVIGNEWTKKDIEMNLDFAKGKVLNVPVSVQSIFRDQGKIKSEINMPDNYLLYPAAGWPHKNHKRLLHAFAEAVEEVSNFQLVLSGSNLKYNKEIHQLILDLNLNDKVIILGFVEADLLKQIYLNSSGVIVPTLFESASFPVWEALILEIPIAGSSVTSLPQQLSNFGYQFDPFSIEEIRVAILKLMRGKVSSPKTRKSGRDYALKFSFENSALGYRFAYRQALEISPDDSDMDWLENGYRF